MTDDVAYDELMALGYRRVPVTVIDGVVVQGYDAAALAVHTRRDADTAGPGDEPSE